MILPSKFPSHSSSAAQILDYLEDILRADPAALGEPHKESPEELGERHERAQAASLAALARLLEALLPKQATRGGPPGAHKPSGLWCCISTSRRFLVLNRYQHSATWWLSCLVLLGKVQPWACLSWRQGMGDQRRCLFRQHG